MPPPPRISDTEWELMRIIWARQPVTAAEIIAELRKEDPTWHPVTAKTLLNRLMRKGVVEAVSRQRPFLYRSRVPEAACVEAVTREFLNRVFHGSAEALLRHLADAQRLPASERRRIRRGASAQRRGGSSRTAA